MNLEMTPWAMSMVKSDRSMTDEANDGALNETNVMDLVDRVCL